MYDKYFNAKIIDKGLQSSEYRDENWDSYIFRIVNITNVNRDLDALKGLREIWNILDLKNIGSLKTTWDALEVAGAVFMVYFKNYIENKQKSQGGDNQTEPKEHEMNGQVNMSGDMDDQSPEGGMSSNMEVS